MTRRLSWRLIAAMVSIPLMLGSSAFAQDEFEIWSPGEDNLWTNDDNWTFDGELSAAPSINDERGAQMNGGLMIIDADVDTAGIIQNGGTIEIQSGSLTSAKTDLQTGVTTFNGNLLISGGAKFTGPDTKTTFGGKSSLQLLAQDAAFEAKGDLSLGGSLHFPVTGAGAPVVQVAGVASIKGAVVPTFDGVTPEFGNSWKFLDGADSVEIGSKANVVLPANVSLAKGLNARVEADGGMASLVIGNLPVLEVNRATGAATISNVVGGDLSFTGYSITSERGLLSGAGFTGTGTEGFVAPNPNDSSLAEFSLEGVKTLSVGETIGIGNAYNGGGTHPLDEDVVFQFSTESGDIIDGLVEYAGPPNDVVLNANPETGEVTLYHLSAFIDPVDVTGYTLTSASGSLNPDNWTSLVDQGVEGWTEANPTGDHISELNLSSSTTLSNGTKFSLGNIYGGTPDLRLQYATASDIFDATITYGVVPDGSVSVCNPNTLGDLDGNGTVEFADFLVLAENFGSDATDHTTGDIDCNGKVEFSDFLVLAENFGRSTGGAAAVPEPNAGLLLGFGGGLLLCLRRRRSKAALTSTSSSPSERFQISMTKPLLLALAVVVASIMTTRQAQADILGYWPFEDDPGGKVVADLSGNGNDGEASDSFAFSPDGFQGQAGDFGDFNNQAFVSILTAADGAFNSIVDTQQATIAFWMNRQGKASDSQWTWIFDGGSDSSDPVTGRQLASHAGWGGGDGTLYFDTGGCCGGTQRINKAMLKDDGTAFGQDGEWHHLTYVRDVDTTSVYVDAELFLQSAEGAITSPVSPIVNATIGANAGGGNSHAGLIDEFAIWDEALPLERIQALADGAPPVGENGPDFNMDGVVNIADFEILAANFGDRFAFGESADKGDFNGDLRVDLKDFLKFRDAFNSQGGGAAASVPEPQAALLLAMAMVGISMRRRRRR